MVVCINRFPTDSENEVALVKKLASEAGAQETVSGHHFAKGGEGAVELAKAVDNTVKTHKAELKFLYDLNMPIKDKIETIAKKIYNAKDVS